MIERLLPCPPRLTCVCSRSDASFFHRIEPFVAPGDPAATFRRLRNLLAEAAHTGLVTAPDCYIHAVCRTRLGFADDLECRLCASERLIHVRSTSRVGIYDFGVNRRRVEALRRRLLEEPE